jgi:hypothetical protein
MYNQIEIKNLIQEILPLALRGIEDYSDERGKQVSLIKLKILINSGIEFKKDHVLKILTDENLVKLKEKTTVNKVDELIDLFLYFQPYAFKYAHGRKTYAVSEYNSIIEKALSYNIPIDPDKDTGLIKAKDGMFDKEWFNKENNKNKFISGLKE